MRFLIPLFYCISISAQIVPVSIDLSNLPLTKQNSFNYQQFHGSVAHFGPTYIYTGNENPNGILQFIRPNTKVPAWIIWQTLDDTNKALIGGGPFMATGMDFANNGDFLVLAYNNILGWDMINAGYKGQIMGHIGLLSGPQPHSAITISDGSCDWSYTHTEPLWSVNSYAANNAYVGNSAKQFSDIYTIWRDVNWQRRWLTFHQGSGAYDWRIGMDDNYNLVVYNGNGDTNTSSFNPGKEIIRFQCYPTNAIILSVPLIQK